MLFVLYCTDYENGLEIRKKTRDMHLQYLDDKDDQILLAGPFLDNNTNKPIGSMIMVEAENMDEARKLAGDDPYAKAGLFKTVDIRVFNWLLGEGKK